MFNKILKSFAEKTSEKAVEAYIKQFGHLQPHQVATTLIAVYSVYTSLARNVAFVDVIESKHVDSNLVNDAIIQVNKLLNKNPNDLMGAGLKFWSINLRCMRDEKLNEMGFKLWDLALAGMEDCKSIVLADVERKRMISGNNAAVQSGMKVVESIGYIPPFFRRGRS
jgi:hypothetical protein